MSLQERPQRFAASVEVKRSAADDAVNAVTATDGGIDKRIHRDTPEYRHITVALLLAGFSTFALLYTAQPLLPLFTTQYGITAPEASLAVSLATGAMALGFIPGGLLSDRVGRLPVMIASMFSPAVFTLLSAAAPNWHAMLLLRALTGLALAGVPSVAMAYVSEEVDAASVGSTMGLYVGGAAIGGMTGRLGVTVLSDLLGWRLALAGMGAVSLTAAVVFWDLAPASRAFAPRRQDVRAMIAATGRLLRDAAFPWLYLEGFLLMGAFVTIYNYVGFRLRLAPYLLSQSAIGSIFLVYLIGSASSAWFGGLAGRIGHRKVFWIPIIGVFGGIALTTLQALPGIILGIAVMTGSFFAAHSTASGWVGRRAVEDRAQAASLYLFAYYMGASILGSAGGFAWHMASWPGVVIFASALIGLAFLISLKLAGVKSPQEKAGMSSL